MFSTLLKSWPSSIRTIYPPLVGISFLNMTKKLTDLWIITFVDTELMTSAILVFPIIRLLITPVINAQSITTSYCSQYYGAGRYQAVGITLWQGLWLSLFYWFFLVIMARIISPTLPASYALARPYFMMITFGSFLYFLCELLQNLLKSINQSHVIVPVLIIRIGLHIGLATWLTIGGLGLPPLGLIGAATGNLLASFIELVLLSLVVFNRFNRDTFHTHRITLQLQLIKDLFRYGFFKLLSAVGILSRWVMINYAFSGASLTFLTFYTFTYNIFNTQTFLVNACVKYHQIVTAQHLGSTVHTPCLKPIIRTNLYLSTAILFIFMTVFMTLYVLGGLSYLSPTGLSPTHCLIGCLASSFLIFLGLLVGMLRGILTAGADTYYLFLFGLWSGIISGLGIAMLATYLIQPSAQTLWLIWLPLLFVSNLLFLSWRFRDYRWLKLRINVQPSTIH